MDQIEHADAAEYGTSEMNEETEITSERLKRVVNRLGEELTNNPKDKPLKKAVKKIRKDYLPLRTSAAFFW
ncbi:hypothetical protein RAC89_02290 [Paenibacillus sp. GD4]|uniref:hypothetical protein n=1 Tax=Paenibacillus sp. GD4 TaxID=3068890 RepID=UPI0027963FC3|nr:hypothetical protein [Paenibacillus sp. GD4]MDQ1909328.1 hypothetical protein [Paenibacillus sp. GD4]